MPTRLKTALISACFLALSLPAAFAYEAEAMNCMVQDTSALSRDCAPLFVEKFRDYGIAENYDEFKIMAEKAPVIKDILQAAIIELTEGETNGGPNMKAFMDSIELFSASMLTFLPDRTKLYRAIVNAYEFSYHLYFTWSPRGGWWVIYRDDNGKIEYMDPQFNTKNFRGYLYDIMD